jgi:hypothetical protein
MQQKLEEMKQIQRSSTIFMEDMRNLSRKPQPKFEKRFIEIHPKPEQAAIARQPTFQKKNSMMAAPKIRNSVTITDLARIAKFDLDDDDDDLTSSINSIDETDESFSSSEKNSTDR